MGRGWAEQWSGSITRMVRIAYSEWSAIPFLKLRSASLSMWGPNQGQNKKYNSKIKISHGVIIVNVVSE